MRVSNRCCLLLGFVALIAPTGVTARADSPEVKDISAAVARLGDSDPAVRSAAADYLRGVGDAARAGLQSAAKSEQPELATRAEALLKPAPLIEPSTPQILSALARYRDAGLAERRRIILELNGRSGAAALAQDWAFERNPDLRQIGWARMLELPALAAPALVAEGNLTTADLLFDQAIANDAPGAAEAYAAIALCRGQVDGAIRQWAERGRQRLADPCAQHVLAALYRAKDDLPAARAAAALAEDPTILENTLLASGDWAAAADRLRRRPQLPLNISQIALLAACDHFAGNEERFNDDVRDLVSKPSEPVEAITAANALILCDKSDEAVGLLKQHRQWSIAFDVLAARGQWDNAFQVVSEREEDSSDQAMLARVSAARLAFRLGQFPRMSALFARIARDTNPAKSPAAFVTMALAERDCGRPREAWEHLSAAFSQAPAEPALLWQLQMIFADRQDEIDGAMVWRLLNESFPADQRKNFARLRSIYDRSMPADQVRDLSRWNGHGPIQSPARVQVALEAARRFADAGDSAHARELIESESRHTESPEIMLRLGDLAARNGDWPHAARWYGLSWDADRSQALPLYLRASVLQELGCVAEANEDNRLARLLSGGDAWQRYTVIRALEERGHSAQAMGEADILLRTAPPMSVGSDVAARLAAMRANERHDAAAEAPLVRAMIVHLSAGAYRFRESSAYVTLPYRLHLTLARAALASGDLDAMRREIQTCRRLVSDEINLAIDLIPELEQGGWRQEADAMFAENLKTQQDFCRQFPNSAMRHNQLAWLCAECKRQLEEGLDHAKRAVELEPTRTAYIDTLAEVYFQRGEIDAAIEQMKRCIALEPKVSRHRVQLEKFEAAKGK